jgi:hypothetical protein
MRSSCYILAAALALILAGCGGNNPFVPPSGPYSGTFFIEGAEAGSFTLTTGDGLLGGTGTLNHAGESIVVSIAAVLDGRGVSGSLSNQQRGSGPFTGGFASSDTVSGDFSFTDSVGLETSSGTWAAHLE